MINEHNGEGGTYLIMGVLLFSIMENGSTHAESQKAPIIGAKFEDIPPIMGKIWIIWRKNCNV